ncbi:hypothetical protein P154DRAFT_500119 [Amniculicola lignicola CBS 123094]|uniref:Uncharacterized protein n=1 Tax=Amniculicola lignicola CBS 123094 TaxID=1392246 RepID=A0A6A5W330_9PLEO|nr:hypothetical protein P154DRAFT_500119 [Amniculicola lignicola CBS 123094]
MKLLTLLSPALFAACALAADPDASPSESAVPEYTPLGQTWSPKWKAADLSSYTKRCESAASFKASIYTLGQMYPELKTFAPELKVFYHRQHYPGSWDGVDKHGNDRELIKMDFDTVPFGVKEWIAKTKQRRYSVQEEVVFFAPGAMYSLLPHWVPESEEKGCDGLFDDLENYSAELEDGKVVATLEYKRIGKHDLEFTIEAFQVKKKAEEKKVEEKDEL